MQTPLAILPSFPQIQSRILDSASQKRLQDLIINQLTTFSKKTIVNMRMEEGSSSIINRTFKRLMTCGNMQSQIIMEQALAS